MFSVWLWDILAESWVEEMRGSWWRGLAKEMIDSKEIQSRNFWTRLPCIHLIVSTDRSTSRLLTFPLWASLIDSISLDSKYILAWNSFYSKHEKTGLSVRAVCCMQLLYRRTQQAKFWVIVEGSENTVPRKGRRWWATIIQSCEALTPSQSSMLDMVYKVFKLLLIMPATNSTLERSFSALRRIKTYGRSMMSHSRLNYLMLLNHHQILIVSLDLNQVGNEYIALCLLKKKVDKQFCVGCKNAF